MKINSKWSKETGKWNGKEFINREITALPDKELEMKFKDGKSSRILEFIGGPTGFESYYVEDLLREPSRMQGRLCICGGTINSWPKCSVQAEEVLAYIQQEEGE